MFYRKDHYKTSTNLFICICYCYHCQWLNDTLQCRHDRSCDVCSCLRQHSYCRLGAGREVTECDHPGHWECNGAPLLSMDSKLAFKGGRVSAWTHFNFPWLRSELLDSEWRASRVSKAEPSHAFPWSADTALPLLPSPPPQSSREAGKMSSVSLPNASHVWGSFLMLTLTWKGSAGLVYPDVSPC